VLDTEAGNLFRIGEVDDAKRLLRSRVAYGRAEGAENLIDGEQVGMACEVVEVDDVQLQFRPLCR